MSDKEPTEYVKAVIGGVITVLCAGLIGMFVWVFNMNADAAKRDTKIEHLESSFNDIVGVLRENTKALNDLRVVIEGLKE